MSFAQWFLVVGWALRLVSMIVRTSRDPDWSDKRWTMIIHVAIWATVHGVGLWALIETGVLPIRMAP